MEEGAQREKLVLFRTRERTGIKDWQCVDLHSYLLTLVFKMGAQDPGFLRIAKKDLFEEQPN